MDENHFLYKILFKVYIQILLVSQSFFAITPIVLIAAWLFPVYISNLNVKKKNFLYKNYRK
jgi:hypothetical protein